MRIRSIVGIALLVFALPSRSVSGGAATIMLMGRPGGGWNVCTPPQDTRTTCYKVYTSQTVDALIAKARADSESRQAADRETLLKTIVVLDARVLELEKRLRRSADASGEQAEREGLSTSAATHN